MPDVTRILSAIDAGDPHAAAGLLPLVYEQLRKLAAAKMAHERPDHSLDATALVHEAYLRLVGNQPAAQAREHWNTRGHFFAAAAEAMRRILVENARRKKRFRYGGGRRRVELDEDPVSIESPVDDLLALDEALEQLSRADQQAAELVKLRHFAGMTTEQAAEVLGLPVRTAYRTWSFARAWLFRHLHRGEESSSS